MPHPHGEIVADVQAYGGSVQGRITLPEGVTGTLFQDGKELPLEPGCTEF
jgi:hypothetical protein